MIRIKRAYEAATSDDGERYLVDRLWPRGITKEALEIRAWLKDVAPSADLRRWFAHDPAKWEQFRDRYAAELAANPDGWRPLLAAARQGSITLVFGAKDTEHNDAVVLKSFLETVLAREPA